MKLNVGKEIAAVERMTVGELRDRYAEVFGEETSARNKQWLIKRIIWRVQSLAEGSLSERARTRAVELANEADIRRRPPKETPAKASQPAIDGPGDSRLPLPGTTISREYKGQLIEVRILPDGFEFTGDRYKSLSAVAKQIFVSRGNRLAGENNYFVTQVQLLIIQVHRECLGAIGPACFSRAQLRKYLVANGLHQRRPTWRSSRSIGFNQSDQRTVD